MSRNHVSPHQVGQLVNEHSMMVQGKYFLTPGTILFFGATANLLTFYILSALADIFNGSAVSVWIKLQDDLIGIGLIFIALLTKLVSLYTRRTPEVFAWLLFFASMALLIVKYL